MGKRLLPGTLLVKDICPNVYAGAQVLYRDYAAFFSGTWRSPPTAAEVLEAPVAFVILPDRSALQSWEAIGRAAAVADVPEVFVQHEYRGRNCEIHSPDGSTRLAYPRECIALEPLRAWDSWDIDERLRGVLLRRKYEMHPVFRLRLK